MLCVSYNSSLPAVLLTEAFGKARCNSYMVTGGDEGLHFLIPGAKSV